VTELPENTHDCGDYAFANQMRLGRRADESTVVMRAKQDRPDIIGTNKSRIRKLAA